MDYPSELSLVEGNRVRHGLTIYNYPNSELFESGDTGPLLGIRLLDEGGRGICGAAMAGGGSFGMSYMD